MRQTLYFQNKNEIKNVSKELSSHITFNQKFKFKKCIYLENEKYLIVISKKFIRVLVFNITNSQDIDDIKKEIYNINMAEK